MSRQHRGVIGAAIATIILAVFTATAFGHSSIERTAPASQARLASAPQQVTVTYAGPLGAARAAEALVAGRDVAGEPQIDSTDRRRLIIPLTDAPTGEYHVSWIVVAADGHPMSGELAFTVRAAPSAPAAAGPVTWVARLVALVETVLCRLAGNEGACG